MVKLKTIVILTFSFVFLFSCAQTKRLEYGDKVLAKKYKNINKFDKSIFTKIDVNYFYKKVDIYWADKNFKKVRDMEGFGVDREIQFYENGRIRFFSFKFREPNPEYYGLRGIIYKKRGKLKIDTQFANQSGWISKGTYSVKVEGNKIYLLDNNLLFPNSEYICHVYQKSEKIPEDWKDYKADW